jgi:hypothetical protein
VSARWLLVGVTHHFTACSSDSSAPGLPLLARRARLRAHPILRVATRRRGAATANKIRGSHCRSGNSARVSSAVSMSALHATGLPDSRPSRAGFSASRVCAAQGHRLMPAQRTSAVMPSGAKISESTARTTSADDFTRISAIKGRRDRAIAPARIRPASCGA